MTSQSDEQRREDNKRMMHAQGIDLKQDPTIYEETSSDGGSNEKKFRLKKGSSNQYSASILPATN